MIGAAPLPTFSFGAPFGIAALLGELAWLNVAGVDRWRESFRTSGQLLQRVDPHWSAVGALKFDERPVELEDQATELSHHRRILLPRWSRLASCTKSSSQFGTSCVTTAPGSFGERRLKPLCRWRWQSMLPSLGYAGLQVEHRELYDRRAPRDRGIKLGLRPHLPAHRAHDLAQSDGPPRFREVSEIPRRCAAIDEIGDAHLGPPDCEVAKHWAVAIPARVKRHRDTVPARFDCSERDDQEASFALTSEKNVVPERMGCEGGLPRVSGHMGEASECPGQPCSDEPMTTHSGTQPAPLTPGRGHELRLVQSCETTAQQLSVSTMTIRRMVRDGRLQAIKVGRQTRVLVSSVEDFIGTGGDAA